MKIGRHIILCVHAVQLQVQSMPQGELTRDSGTCILLANVVDSTHLLILFAHAVRYTHVYLACI